MTPFRHRDAVRCAEEIIARVGHNIFLAVPIGIGKPTLLVNALYGLAEADRRLNLTIFTGLTLVRPRYGSGLERRFVAPLLERLFGSYPDLAYVAALRAGTLPPNVKVHEFFLQAGAWLSSPAVQQDYVSMNYTQVAAHLARLGVNVFGQLLAPGRDGESRLSLGSNPDITLDMRAYIAQRRAAGQPLVLAGEINGHMPYMPGPAEVDATEIDVLLEPAEPHYALFAPPKEPVTLTDYAMGLNAATLVKDGGTLQIGIGSFADALTHALILRHTRNTEFRALLAALGTPQHPAAELGPFADGLYGCSEMLVDGFLHLKRAGILRRRVQDRDGRSAVVHAGFFVGSTDFYRALREMPRAELEEIVMTAISFTNALLGDEELKRTQRRHARFINTGLAASVLGAVASDQIDDARVLSGVGGQHDFVTMAHQLADARSIIAIRSSRLRRGRLSSNVIWQLPSTTVPRHLRDIVVTEYGVADLRGKSDRDTIVEMIGIADGTFQPDLLAAAKTAGKVERSFTLPPALSSHRAGRIRAALQPARRDGLLPPFPLGTEMTETEQALIGPLGRLKSASPWDLGRILLAGLGRAALPGAEEAALARMDLLHPKEMADHLQRALLLGALR